MPVETATFIPQLNAADPVHTDSLAQADSHLRLIKTVLQNQFPNIGTVAVSVTAVELNNAGSMTAVTGAVQIPQQSTIAGGTAVLTQAGGSGGALILLNGGTVGGAGVLDIVLQDTLNANPHVALTSDYAGNVVALASLNAPSIKQAGNALIPTGFIGLWSGSATAIPAGWLLCDGTSGTPDLRGKFIIAAGNTGAGAAFGPGATGGAASVTPTSSSAGTHSHGGLTGAAGAQALGGFTDAQGAHSHGGGTDNHTLTLTEIPPHAHNAFTGGSGGGGPLPQVGGGGTPNFSSATDVQGSGGGHNHTIQLDGAHSHNLTVTAIPNHQHSVSSDGDHTHTVAVATMPPYYALCYIMKS